MRCDGVGPDSASPQPVMARASSLRTAISQRDRSLSATPTILNSGVTRSVFNSDVKNFEPRREKRTFLQCALKLARYRRLD